MPPGTDIVDHGKLTFLGRYIIPIAIRHRNRLALRYITNAEGSLLDVGGGRGYLVRESPCRNNLSIDEQCCISITRGRPGSAKKETRTRGITITKTLPYRAATFDYVTMIAVIEHFNTPADIVEEAHRVLRPGGLLIMTTPRPVVESILKFLDRGSDQLRGSTVHEEHQHYFDLTSMKLLSKGFTLVEYRRFQLGVNQLFVFKKNR